MSRAVRERVRWHLSARVLQNLSLLSGIGAHFTVENAFGAPGDTLLAATVCRILKERFPGLRLNLRTKWPELVGLDPCLHAVNGPDTYFGLRFWYLETVARKEQQNNVLLETLKKVGITEYCYRSRFYLAQDEVDAAQRRLPAQGGRSRPRLAFSTLSKELVKNWPEINWRETLASLQAQWTLVHLGDNREPEFNGVLRFAGKLSMRESVATLACCDVYAGPDSFLMHAANGVNVASVILFGGSRPAACLGYAENINLFVPMACGPCWLHDSEGDVCAHGIACMDEIRPSEVQEAIERLRIRALGQSAIRAMSEDPVFNPQVS